MQELLSVSNLTTFRRSGVRLHGLNFNVYENEILGMIGSEGSGLRELVRVFDGEVRKYRGEIQVRGTVIRAKTAEEFQKAGIFCIRHESRMIPEKTVFENLLILHTYGRKKRLDREKIEQKYRDMFAGYGIPADLMSRRAEELSAFERGMVEAVSAAYSGAAVLILDGVLSGISETEFHSGIRILREMMRQKIGILLIHKNAKYETEADTRIMILKNGSKRGIWYWDDLMEGELEEILEELEEESRVHKGPQRQKRNAAPGTKPAENTPLMEADRLQAAKKIHSLQFVLSPGEIIGFLDGRMDPDEETVRMIAGGLRKRDGVFRIGGRDISSYSRKEAVARGVRLLNSENMQAGIFRNQTVRENLILALLYGHGRAPFSRMRNYLWKTYLPHSNIPEEFYERKAGTLGSDWKSVLSLECCLIGRPEVIIIDNLSTQCDLFLQRQLEQYIVWFREAGKGVIYQSSSISEMSYYCDRLYLTENGKTKGYLESTGKEGGFFATRY